FFPLRTSRMITIVDKRRIVILAEAPVWIIPALSSFQREGHPLTWLEALLPEMGKAPDIEIHWITFSKKARRLVVHRDGAQTFYILPRWRKLASMCSAYLWEILQVRKLIRSIQPHAVHAWGSE